MRIFLKSFLILFLLPSILFAKSDYFNQGINLFNKKCFVEICKKLNLNLIQLNNIKNQNLRTKIKILKNNYLFNFVVLQKVT